jgi:hypothetical protein
MARAIAIAAPTRRRRRLRAARAAPAAGALGVARFKSLRR